VEALFSFLQGVTQFANQQQKFLRISLDSRLLAENLPSFFVLILHWASNQACRSRLPACGRFAT
jgi:hypothetical protein